MLFFCERRTFIQFKLYKLQFWPLNDQITVSFVRAAGVLAKCRMRPFASTPAARTKVTVIWSLNGQNCSFYHLNWINVRRSQKNSMLFFIQNVFYAWKYDFY